MGGTVPSGCWIRARRHSVGLPDPEYPLNGLGRQGWTAANLDLFEVRVDDVAVATWLARFAFRAGGRLGPGAGALGLAIDGFADLLHGRRQLLAARAHALDVVVLDRLLHRLDLAFDL